MYATRKVEMCEARNLHTDNDTMIMHTVLFHEGLQCKSQRVTDTGRMPGPTVLLQSIQKGNGAEGLTSTERKASARLFAQHRYMNIYYSRKEHNDMHLAQI